MDTSMSDEDLVLGPMISLRALMAAIRRNRRVWLATGLVGLIVGASLHLVIPHKYSAVTDLYLAQPAGADPAHAMADDVSLLQTEAVAKQAVSTGRLHVSPSALRSHYAGFPVSDNIISIKFNGSSRSDAVSGDRAVAQAFLALQAKELRLQTDVLVRGLRSQISSLNAAISSLNSQINSLSSPSPNGQSANQLTDLVNQRGADATQVAQLQAQAEQALLNEQSVDHVSHVLDPAALVPVSTKKVILVDAFSGLVAGLAVGLAAVIFTSLLSELVPGRSTVAATLGAPVELSLGRYPESSCDAQTSVVSTAERAELSPTHDRTSPAWPSRICTRIGIGSRNHRNR